VFFYEVNMSEDNQSQSENQPQASSDNQTAANSEDTPPKLQAVEPTPMPEPSFGTIDLSEDIPSLTLEKNVGSSPRPNPSFETHLKDTPRKSFQTDKKRNNTE
jgi:hypothetical protein